MARILIGVPTKNRPGFLRETIESVLGQSYQDIRVLISDNRSEPHLSARVRSFVEELGDPRIEYYLQERDEGEYGQGRFLFGRCAEDYFMILHDDDLLEPDFLDSALGVLERDPSVAFFGASQLLIDAEGNSLPELTASYNRRTGREATPEGRIEELLDAVMTRGSIFTLSATVFRRSALLESGLVDEDLWGLYPFDFNVFLRQAESGFAAYYSRKQLGRYRWHEDSITSRDSHYFNRIALAMVIRLLERRRFKGPAERGRWRYLSFAYRNYAYILYVAGDRRACYRCLARAIRLNPLAWNIWAYGVVAVVLPFLIRPLWGPRIRLRLLQMDMEGQQECRLDLES